jgi:hypothetical protein
VHLVLAHALDQYPDQYPDQAVTVADDARTALAAWAGRLDEFAAAFPDRRGPLAALRAASLAGRTSPTRGDEREISYKG